MSVASKVEETGERTTPMRKLIKQMPGIVLCLSLLKFNFGGDFLGACLTLCACVRACVFCIIMIFAWLKEIEFSHIIFILEIIIVLHVNCNDSQVPLFNLFFTMNKSYTKSYTKVIYKANEILGNENHVLNPFYQYLRSGRRLEAIKCRTERYRKSFVPLSVRMFNNTS